MNEVVPAQWAPDPYGRHQLRYWDGTGWTEHVLDDNLPGRDPLTGRAEPARTPAHLGAAEHKSPQPWDAQPTHARRTTPSTGEPRQIKPLMSGQAHAGVAVLTCGLWLLIAPAVYWLRRGSYKVAAIWATAWLLLIIIANVTDTSSTGTVTATDGSSTSTAQGLLGGAAASTTPTAARSTSASTKPGTPSAPATAVKRPKTKTTTAARQKTTKRKTTAPAPARTTTKKTVAPKLDPRFGTCGEANDNGYGPYYEGQDPEYDWYRDRDGDGIVCEY